MIRKSDYFKLGAFIVLGTGMLLAVIVILGAGRFFETTYPLETYFDESVNGLSVGSPVKLRGVAVGRVSEINFVSNIYPQAKDGEARYVYVKCDITPNLFENIPNKKFAEYVKQEVKRGLRMRPTSLGLTGQLFLNTIYEDPQNNQPLPLGWEPKAAYVPSVPSTLNRVEGAITSISKTLSGLKQEDLESIIKDVKSIVGTINDFMNTEGGKEAGKRLLDIFEETHGILARTNRLMADPRMDQALSDIAPTLENISKASADLTASVSKIHALVNRLNGAVASEEGNIHAIIQDTRETMQNVKELTGDAKRNPSGILFGTPPTKINPEAK